MDNSIGADIIGGNCLNPTTRVWEITPAVGWTTGGALGSTNGFIGSNYDVYSWTSGSQSLVVNFNTPGNYSIKMLTGNSCSQDSLVQTICIQAPPIPSFTAPSVNVCAPTDVHFTNTSSGLPTCGPISRLWTVTKTSFTCMADSTNDFVFISGTNSASVDPIIRFNNQGVYNVTFSLTNICGTFTTVPTIITVKRKPQVTFSVPSNICLGQTISPTSTVTNCSTSALTYLWNFSGGTPSSSTLPNPTSISFITTGSHVVSLSVTNECGTTTLTTTVNVLPLPIANAGTDIQFCSGGSATIGSVTTSGITYMWSPTTGISAANISNPTITLANSGINPITTVYTLTVSNAANCSSTDVVSVTVNPLPTVTANSATICAGQTVSITASGANSYLWSTGGLTATIPVTPLVSTSYTVTGTTTLTGCANTAISNVTVNLLPTITNTPLSQTICGGGTTTSVAWTSVVAGTTYSWSGSSANGITGFPVSGTGNLPVMTLNNPNTTQGSVVYLVTPTANGCAGAAITYTVFVNPIPNVNTLIPQTICSGSNTVAVNLTSNVLLTTFSWTASGANVTGFTALGNGNIPLQPLVNTTNSPQTVVYVITPTANGCLGTPVNYTVTVNPSPSVQFTPINQTICSGNSTALVTLTSATAGATITWTCTPPAGITGASTSGTTTIPVQALTNTTVAPLTVDYLASAVTTGGAACPGAVSTYSIIVNPITVASASPSTSTICSGTALNVALTATVSGTTYNWTVGANANISGAMAGTGNAINQTLINNSSTVQTIIYTITPTANACNGSPITVTITVNPAPSVTFTPAPQAVCSGQNTTLVTLGSSTAGVTYSWTSAANGAVGVSPIGTNTIPVQTLTNVTANPITVVYTANAMFGGGCAGPSANYNITVNPIPDVTNTPLSQTICGGGTTTSVVWTSVVAGTTYSWSGSSANGITGFPVSGTGNLPVMTLNNPNTTQGSVVYLVTPTANGCAGAAITYTVFVNPIPNVNTLIPQTICSGSNTVAVNLTSNVLLTTFSWTASGANVTGFTALGNGNIPLQPLVNTTNSPQTVVYVITPTANGCLGTPVNYTVTVNPSPSVQFTPINQTICSGNSTALVTLTSATAGATITWTCTPPAGITGASTSGTTTIPVQALTNTTVAPLTVDYLASAVTTGGAACPGAVSTYSIIVNPITVASASPSTSTICSGTALNVALTATVSGTTYNWTVGANANISGAMAGTGNAINQTLINNSSTVQTIIYTITPTANACNGSPITVTITVNPAPSVTFTPAPQAVCSGQNTTLVTLGSSTAGVTYSWTSAANGAVGVSPIGTNTIPVQLLTNITSAPIIVVYTASSNFGGCSGVSASYNITVNPLPVVLFSNPAFGCVNTPISFTNGTSGGSTYSWGFGDGASSMAFSPSNTYTTIGNYTIQLIAYTPLGCSDSTTSTIQIIDVPVSNYSTLPPVGCAPLAVSFPNNSSGVNVSYLWDFGNGNTSANLVAPIQTYQQGLYDTVYYTSLSVSNQCGINIYHDSVIVHPTPVVDFGMNVNSGCSPINIFMINNSTGNADQYVWDFGDGSLPITTSNSDTLAHTFTTGTSDTTYIITLVGMNACGDDTITQTVLVHPNTVMAFFNSSSISGCAPHTITFTDYSQGATFISWDFGDGNVTTTTSPIHTYQNSGIYVCHEYINNGCSYDTATVTVTIHPTPALSFTPSAPFVCANQPVVFTNTSTNCVNFNWSFGDGTFSNLNNPSHIYANGGTYTVTLTGTSTSFGCTDSTMQTFTVNSLPSPNVTPSDSFGCLTLVVNFTNTTTNANFYHWDFGDGIYSMQANPTHIYTATGVYYVNMVAQNLNGCFDSTQVQINVYPNPSAFFTLSSPFSCALPTTLNLINGSIGATSYLWDFGNGITSSLLNPSVTYSTNNTYAISLISTNTFNCSDTATNNFTIYQPPQASFSTSVLGGCQPLEVSFLNQTLFGNAYSWTFGDNVNA